MSLPIPVPCASPQYSLGYAIGAAVTAAQFAHQIADLERRWLMAEHDADHWYAIANNPGFQRKDTQ